MFAICLNSLKRYKLISRLPLNCGRRVRELKTNNCHMIDETLKGGKYYKDIFGKYLIWTNVLSCGILMSAGDLVEQEIEHVKMERHKDGFDWIRNKNLSIVGACQGLFSHYFYKILDAMLPGVEMFTIAKKILLDQSIASPLCIIILFGGLELLGNRDYEAFKTQMKDKYWMTFAIDCIIWMPAQFINFYLLPPRFRVMYVNLVTMCYNVFLSYIIHA